MAEFFILVAGLNDSCVPDDKDDEIKPEREWSKE